MILKTVYVKNFKCVRDSGEFKIDESITCLVGKNEAGKTALLQALYKLNPIRPADVPFQDMEYPRWDWSKYKERAAEDPADAIITTWTLEDGDAAAVEAVIGPKSLTSRDVEIKRGYYKNTTYTIEVDEPAVVAHLLTEFSLHPDVRDRLREHKTLTALHEDLAAQPEPTEPEQELLKRVNGFRDLSPRKAAIDVLRPRLPKFVYIPEYFRLPGQVSIEDLKKRIANQAQVPLEKEHEVFLSLLALIGATIADLENIKQYEKLQAELEAASVRVSQEIFRYWSQNRHLVVRVRFEAALPEDPAPFNSGYIVRTRIENTRHFSTVSFDEQSAGFVWFFSFLVWFSQAKKNYGDNLIVLLDEPGLTLHAKAQADLLRYMEEQLAPKSQVIYTAHSPFMIDPTRLLRARTVEDVYTPPKDDEPPPAPDTQGTKVGDDVLSTDRDTVFPLQAALGFEITQTLFVAPDTLLVEGPSEIVYFEWFRQKLRALGRTALDRRWVLAPCGSIDKIPAFMSLFRGIHVGVFTDYDKHVKKRVMGLRESKLLKDGHVLSAEMYAGQSEADVEDLLGREMYIELVARTYELQVGQTLPTVRPADAPERVVKEVEMHFKTLPPAVKEFDHYAPAEHLMLAGLNVAWPGLAVALDRFEKLFTDLNAMLPAA